MEADTLLRKTLSPVSPDCNGRRLFYPKRSACLYMAFSWFLMALFLLLSHPPPTPSFYPHEQDNPSCEVSGFFCGHCSLSVIFFIRTERLYKRSWYLPLLASLQPVSLPLIRSIFLKTVLSCSRELQRR